MSDRFADELLPEEECELITSLRSQSNAENVGILRILTLISTLILEYFDTRVEDPRPSRKHLHTNR